MLHIMQEKGNNVDISGLVLESDKNNRLIILETGAVFALGSGSAEAVISVPYGAHCSHAPLHAWFRAYSYTVVS
jgi:hypothetical protein